MLLRRVSTPAVQPAPLRLRPGVPRASTRAMSMGSCQRHGGRLLRTRSVGASAAAAHQVGLIVRATARRLHGSGRGSTGKTPPVAEAAAAKAAATASALPTPGLAAVLSPSEFHTFVKRYGPVALGASPRHVLRVRPSRPKSRLPRAPAGTLALVDVVVFTGAYLCVRTGLKAEHLQYLVETLHLTHILSLLHIDLSPDSKLMKGTGNLVVTFVLYKMVRPHPTPCADRYAQRPDLGGFALL